MSVDEQPPRRGGTVALVVSHWTAARAQLDTDLVAPPGHDAELPEGENRILLAWEERRGKAKVVGWCLDGVWMMFGRG